MSTTAKLLVREDGTRWGTVGGGCLEGELTELALDVARQGEPRLVERHLTADLAGDIGLTCGGTVELLVEPVFPHPSLAAVYQGAVAILAAGGAGACVTALPWNGTPAKLLVADGEIVGGTLNTDHDAAVELTLAAGEAARRVQLGSRDAVLEPITQAPRVVVFGGGHVGVHVARVARLAGLRVTVMDDRAEYASAERFPGCEVAVGPYHEIAAHVRVPVDAFVVITTRGHEHDAVVLEQVLQDPPRYVGMIGSRRKAALTLKALAARGVPADRLALVKSPVGLAIGADTPGEIAVSIVAQLVAERRGAAGG
jgi:xanthine dehydrogenase accessory factor